MSGLKENKCLLAQLQEDIEIVLAPVNAIGELIMEQNLWNCGNNAYYGYVLEAVAAAWLIVVFHFVLWTTLSM